MQQISLQRCSLKYRLKYFKSGSQTNAYQHGKVKYFMVETCDYIAIIKTHIFREYVMTQKNDLDVLLRETCKTSQDIQPSPYCTKTVSGTHTGTHKKRKNRTNILPVIFSEWVELWIILMFFLHILLDFPNRYNDFPNQAIKQNRNTETKVHGETTPFSASRWRCLCIRSSRGLHPAWWH